jgi:hypothetical protein
MFVPYAQLDFGTGVTLKRVRFDQFRDTVWTGLEPLAFAVGSVLAVTVVYSRSAALASGLLLGLGVGALFLYGDSIGYISLTRTPFNFRAGDFIGLVGALMVLATGVATLARSQSSGS